MIFWYFAAIPFVAIFTWFFIDKSRRAQKRRYAVLPRSKPKLDSSQDKDIFLPVTVPPGVRVPPGTVAVKEEDPLMVRQWRAAKSRLVNAEDRHSKAIPRAKKDTLRLKAAQESLAEMETQLEKTGYNLKNL